MKTNSISMFKKVILVSLGVLVTSCNLFNAEDKTLKSEKSVIIIISDASRSIKLTDTEFEKEKVWLKKYFHSNFTAQSDVVLMSIDNSSGSSLNDKEFLWRYPKAKQQDEYKSETDKIMQVSQIQSDNMIQIAQTQKMILQELENQFHSEATNQSKIIEIMPQLEVVIKKGKYDSSKIIFISDMCQSSNKRTFNSQSLQSKQKAEQYALGDAKAIAKEFSLSQIMLQKVSSITILVPTQANDTYEVLPFYYEEFYSYFGYKKPIIWESL